MTGPDPVTAPRRLLLIRHAKSDQSLGLPDHERPLNRRGQADSAALGRWLGQQPPTDRVLCSTAVRTRQTHELTGLSAPTDFEHGLYLSDTAATIGLISLVEPQVYTLVIIGHEPTQSQLTQALASPAVAHDRAAWAHFQQGFVTSAVAVLELAPGLEWAALGPESCRLADFVVPRG